MKFVLHLKHWQLFLVTFGIPMALYICLFIAMFFTMMTNGLGGDPDFPVALIVFGIFIGLAWFTGVLTLMIWFFQVATGLYAKRPAGSSLKIKRFYFAYFFPMIYLAIFIICMLGFTAYASTHANEMKDPASFMWIFLVVFPLHLFAMACGMYVLYFVAKALKSYEQQRNPELGDFVGDFVLTWFFMIGVWFIQPRINKIFSEQPDPDSIISTSPS